MVQINCFFLFRSWAHMWFAARDPYKFKDTFGFGYVLLIFLLLLQFVLICRGLFNDTRSKVINNVEIIWITVWIILTLCRNYSAENSTSTHCQTKMTHEQKIKFCNKCMVIEWLINNLSNRAAATSSYMKFIAIQRCTYFCTHAYKHDRPPNTRATKNLTTLKMLWLTDHGHESRSISYHLMRRCLSLEKWYLIRVNFRILS